MNNLPTTGAMVLSNATLKQLEQAVALNHKELFCLNAIAQGGEVYSKHDITCTYAAAGGNIAFPPLTPANAGALLNEIMDWYKTKPPAGIGYWSLQPVQPANLDVLLLARGFQTGWRPNWMTLDLEAMNEKHAAPANLQLIRDNTTPTHACKDLPYAGDSGAFSHAAMLEQPEKIQRFIATLDGKTVGHAAALLTTGPYGVAGLYNVGVVPEARQQGIGKAAVLAVCRYAKEKGYRYAVLNGTGRRMYEQVGFRTIGNGITWWLQKEAWVNNPPTRQQVALAEAIGHGDIPELDRMAKQLTSGDLNTPLANGMRLLELAAHCWQPAAGEWLIRQGTICTALDAWDMGWKDRAAALLATNPQEVNRQYGHKQQTLLHTAAERNDIRLAQLALSAKPDLEIKDTMYHSTPLGWAQHLRREQIEKLITSHIP
jgi:predicted N-acetyltransferase YhbS